MYKRLIGWIGLASIFCFLLITASGVEAQKGKAVFTSQDPAGEKELVGAGANFDISKLGGLYVRIYFPQPLKKYKYDLYEVYDNITTYSEEWGSLRRFASHELDLNKNYFDMSLLNKEKLAEWQREAIAGGFKTVEYRVKAGACKIVKYNYESKWDEQQGAVVTEKIPVYSKTVYLSEGKVILTVPLITAATDPYGIVSADLPDEKTVFSYDFKKDEYVPGATFGVSGFVFERKSDEKLPQNVYIKVLYLDEKDLPDYMLAKGDAYSSIKEDLQKYFGKVEGRAETPWGAYELLGSGGELQKGEAQVTDWRKDKVGEYESEYVLASQGESQMAKGLISTISLIYKKPYIVFVQSYGIDPKVWETLSDAQKDKYSALCNKVLSTLKIK